MKKELKTLSILIVGILLYGCSSDSWDINSIPLKKSNGLLWDVINGPDVISGIVAKGNTLVTFSTTINNVTLSSLPIKNTISSPYQVPSFSDIIDVFVLDDDKNDIPSTENEPIGLVSFTMNDYITGSNKYPSTVYKADSNGTMITLHLVWE
jgi:hypothetical protein